MGERARRGTAGAFFVATILGVCVACASDGTTSASTNTTPDPSRPTVATVPPSTVPHTEPTTLRPLAVDPAVIGVLFPLSPTEVLSIDRHARPDRSQTPLFWTIDVATGTVTELPSPPVNVRNYTSSDSFTQHGEDFAFAAATCEDVEGSCVVPTVELWQLDSTSRRWGQIGSYEPGELVGQPWDGRDLMLGQMTSEDGHIRLGVSDDGDYAENRGHHDIVIDPDTGRFERKESVFPDDLRCSTRTGADARIELPDRFVQTRPTRSDDWATLAGSAPTWYLACGASSVWARTDSQWINVGADGIEISSRPLPEQPEETNGLELGCTEYHAVGEGTDHVGLVMQQRRHWIADYALRASEVEILVMTGADREPLGTVIPNAGELAGGTAGGGQNVQGSHCLPPFALQLPGGRLVILSPDPAAPLLVAE